MNLKDTMNPHLKFQQGEYSADILKMIKKNMEERGLKKIKLLDVGGGKGWGKLLYEKPFIDYYVLDINSDEKRDENITYIKGDITNSNLIGNINHKFDIIFTKDTFEHILNPWDSTQNILDLLNENGLFIFLAPFKWRYHASPYDTYRYTHTGAQYMFERLGGLKRIYAGYINFYHINTPGFWGNKKDWTFDHKPFTNPIETIYVGERVNGYEFKTENLDSDFDWKHEK